MDTAPLGASAVTTALDSGIEPGVIFCLRAEAEGAAREGGDGYPLEPHYLVHVGDDGNVILPYTQAKEILDRLKRLCVGRDLPDATACARSDRATRGGDDMRHSQQLLAASIASVVGKSEERAVASLFTSGGTHGLKGEFMGMDDFEAVAYLVVLGEEAMRA